jgi:hypothetical protein
VVKLFPEWRVWTNETIETKTTNEKLRFEAVITQVREAANYSLAKLSYARGFDEKVNWQRRPESCCNRGIQVVDDVG